MLLINIWHKLIKNELNKTCGRKVLKNLKWYGNRPYFLSLFIYYLLLSWYLHSILINLNRLKVKVYKHDKIKLDNTIDKYANWMETRNAIYIVTR